MKSTKLLWLGVIALALLFFATYLIPNLYLSRNAASQNNNGNNYGNNNNYYNGSGWGSGYGMMGSYRGMMGGYGRNGGMMGGSFGYNSNQYSNEGLTEDNVNSVVDESSKNATINKNKNSITYSGNNIKIVLLGSPKQDDKKFVIDGLVNPTVYIPKNANVTLELINGDEDVPHAVEITNAAPPYAYTTMMQGEIYPGSFVGNIPPSSNGKSYAASTSFTASYEGEFYYICQYPSHAAEGMYGKIIVK